MISKTFSTGENKKDFCFLKDSGAEQEKTRNKQEVEQLKQELETLRKRVSNEDLRNDVGFKIED